MSLNERIYKIDQLLSERKAISADELLEVLQVSRATLKRDLALLRDRMNAPIIFDRALGGYCFDKQARTIGPAYELPGLWFSANEIYALLTMYHLISNLDAGGLLGPHIKPLQARLSALLCSADNSSEEIRHRIKVEMVGVRHFRLEHFETLGAAVLKRKRLKLSYHARSKNQTTEREVSPQRLVYYQGNWYMDAWCHVKNDLRSFSVDMIKRVEMTDKKAKEISEKSLNEILGSGYGIFSGRKVQWATLIFSEDAARWVSAEQWHPAQKGRLLEDGSYELKIPYSHSTELIMDILRYGSKIKVISPKKLVDSVDHEITQMAKLYRAT